MHNQQECTVDYQCDQAESEDVEREGNNADEVSDDRIDHAEYCCDYEVGHDYFHGRRANKNHGVVGIGGHVETRHGPHGDPECHSGNECAQQEFHHLLTMPGIGLTRTPDTLCAYAGAMVGIPGGGVVFRPEIAQLPVYKQGRPPAPGGFKLSSNETPFPPLPQVVEALAKGEWNRYPDATAAVLREKLGQKLGVSPDWLLIGAGSVALLQQFILATSGPGDNVVHAWRSFEAYPGLVTVSGAESRRVPNRADHGHDIEKMCEAVDERTRLVIVCSPNNPTSTVVITEEFQQLMAQVPAHCLVLLDEAYREFVDHPEAVRGEEQWANYPNLVVLRTFSKAFGLAGMRIGYAVGHPGLLAPAMSAGIPLAVSAPAQIAAEVCLDHSDTLAARVSEVVARVARVRDELASLHPQIPAPYGNFLWIPTSETDTVQQWLEAEGLVGRVFHGEGVRVSIAEEQAVEPLLRIVKRVVSDLPKTPSTTRLG